VPLSGRSVATVPIFDVKAQLIAFLSNPLQMPEENFASNHDIFTGKKKQASSTLDEIHTGSLWEMARLKYCGDDPAPPPKIVRQLISEYVDCKKGTDFFKLTIC
jgi:hypothetical protein